MHQKSNTYHNKKFGSIECIVGPMFCGKTTELLRRLRMAQVAKLDTILFKPKPDNRYSAGEAVTHDNIRANSFIIEDASELPKRIEEGERLIQKLFQARALIREQFQAGKFSGIFQDERELSERLFSRTAIPGIHVFDPSCEPQSGQRRKDKREGVGEGRILVVGIDEVQFIRGNIAEVCSGLRDRGIRVVAAGLDMDFLKRSFEIKPTGNVGDLLAIADEVSKFKAVCIDCGDPASFSKRLTGGKNVVEVGGPGDYVAMCQSCYAEPEEDRQKKRARGRGLAKRGSKK
jgi:thymidine kinase